jgi:hypothetical protein
LKKIIDDFIDQNDTILTFLDGPGRDYANADKIIPLFVDMLRQTKFNAALGPDFACVLQLSNDKNTFEQYSLADIRRLFIALLRIQDVALDTHLEAANFEWSVMDNSDRAKAIIAGGLDKTRQKIDELNKLLDKINSG